MTFEEWWDRPEGCGSTPDTYKGWEKSCHAAWDASAASRDTEIESLRQQLETANSDLADTEARRRNLGQQLAAALAAIKIKDAALQSAISAHGYGSGDLHDALAIQPDDAALKEGLDQAWCRDPDQ